MRSPHAPSTNAWHRREGDVVIVRRPMRRWRSRAGNKVNEIDRGRVRIRLLVQPEKTMPRPRASVPFFKIPVALSGTRFPNFEEFFPIFGPMGKSTVTPRYQARFSLFRSAKTGNPRRFSQ